MKRIYCVIFALILIFGTVHGTAACSSVSAPQDTEALIPKSVRGKVNDALQEKGIEADIDNIKPEDIDEILSQIDYILVNMEGKEIVRIFCE